MKKYSIIEIISIISIISLFFSGFLKTIVSPVFGYIDECILIIYILIYVSNLLIKKTKTISKNSIILILNSILMVILGLIGNYASDYQNVKFAIIVDMFSWLKFFFMFAITYEVVKQERVNKYYEIAKKLSIFFVISGYIVYGLILIGKLNMGSRYGIKVFSLGGHPSFACAFYAVIISIFLHKYNENKKTGNHLYEEMETSFDPSSSFSLCLLCRKTGRSGYFCSIRPFFQFRRNFCSASF